MAGFHFNSALLRLSAVYHRSLKILTGEHRPKVYVDELLKKLQPLYQGWTSQSWSNTNIHRIHSEVNALKHDSAGVSKGRDVAYAHALDAVEELLELWEACPTFR